MNENKIYEFLNSIKPDANTNQLDWQSDSSFIKKFEAPRIAEIINIISKKFNNKDKVRCLEVGFLHGFTPKSIVNFLDNTEVVCIDRPSSEIFQSEEVKNFNSDENSKIKVKPLDLNETDNFKNEIGKFDVIILGEVIEHIDPIFCSTILKNFYNNFLEGGEL